MKFDFVIGNPPYQDNKTGDNETYAPPVYQFFMNAAFAIAKRVQLITPARFLFNAGSTSKYWNHKMLTDKHFMILDYMAKSSDVFRNTEIKGGGGSRSLTVMQQKSLVRLNDLFQFLN